MLLPFGLGDVVLAVLCACCFVFDEFGVCWFDWLEVVLCVCFGFGVSLGVFWWFSVVGCVLVLVCCDFLFGD